MASYVFDQVKTWVVTGKLDFKNGSKTCYYKIALLSDPDIVNNWTKWSKKKLWSDIPDGYEVSISPDTNYKRKQLYNVGNENTKDFSSDKLFDTLVYADDISYIASTMSVSCVLIVRSLYAGDNIIPGDELVVAIDIRKSGSSISTNDGVFTVKLSKASDGSGGFLIIK